MGAAVEANNRLTVEIFQGQRGEAEPFLPLQQPFSLRPLRFGNKGDGLLRREGYLQRTVVGGKARRRARCPAECPASDG